MNTKKWLMFCENLKKLEIYKIKTFNFVWGISNPTDPIGHPGIFEVAITVHSVNPQPYYSWK